MQHSIIIEDSRIPSPVSKLVEAEVGASLKNITTIGDKLTVNDTKWFWLTPKNELKPSVVNSAKYITGKFASELRAQNWTTEKTLNGQRIDGYKEVAVKLPVFNLKEENYLNLLAELRTRDLNNYGEIATTIFQRYVKSSQPYLLEELAGLAELFEARSASCIYRIGLEFETGNIASSFRAIQKLDSLYDIGMIDAGVFITSIDKGSCAARIWPVSNRNGSFEELNNRNYRANRSYPAIDIGFKPDDYSVDAPYLSETGQTYFMSENGIVDIGGVEFVEASAHDGVKKYRPA